MAHPFIPAPNTALVELVFSYGTQIIENTFHVQKGSPYTVADLTALQVIFDNWDNATAGGKSLRNNSCTLQQIKCRALDTPSSPVWIYVLPVARPGTNSGGTQMPGNVTFCITFQTGHAGRSQRGRLFMVGLTSNFIQGIPNQNLIVPAVAAGWVVAYNTLIANIAAVSGQNMVVTSFYTAGAWRATASNTVVTNAAFADLNLDSQRRRLAGRGH